MYQKFRETHLFAFLEQFDQTSLPLDAAFSDYLKAHKSIGAHDRRFLGDTIYTLMRWQGLLDFWLKKKSSWKDRYDLFRRIDIHSLPEDLPMWVRSGSSRFIFEELSSSFGSDRAFELCRILNDPAPLTVRVNLLKISRDQLLDRWKDLGAVPCAKSLAGIRFKDRIALTTLPEFKEGLFEIQDEGSQRIADLVQPKRGEHVLDFCSGSGGKSLAIGARMDGRGQIYLHDIRSSALVQAKKRFKRSGIQQAQFLLPEHPQLKKLINQADWVLADVPCSGSGTLRRNPDMKWKIASEMVERLVSQQREIFTQAVSFVRPGGKIVYATCSIFLKENMNQVEYFLKTLPLELAETPLDILPEQNGADGFFGAVFNKKSPMC